MRHFSLILFILMPILGFASPAEEPEEYSVPILESVQGLFGGQFNYVANRLDSFFATERADDEFGRSRIRIKSQFFIRERVTSNLKTQYRINLKLPHLEQKFKYEFDEKNKSPASPASAAIKKPTENKGWIFN